MEPEILQAVGRLDMILPGMVVMTNQLKRPIGDTLQHALARFTKTPTFRGHDGH